MDACIFGASPKVKEADEGESVFNPFKSASKPAASPKS